MASQCLRNIPGPTATPSSDHGKVFCKDTITHPHGLACRASAHLCKAVATSVNITPRHHGAIAQNGCRGTSRGLNLLHVPQSILHNTAVATMEHIAPSHHGAISTDGCKSPAVGLNLLHTPQSMLHSTAVATKFDMAPRHHGAIAKDGCKSARAGLNLLHIPQSILHSTAVATTNGPTSPPRHQQGWLQKPDQRLESAAHSSVDLAQHCCRHHKWHGPTSPPRHQRGWQFPNLSVL